MVGLALARPLTLPRWESVMDVASGSAAEEAEAHLLEPIRGGGASTSGLFAAAAMRVDLLLIPSYLLALVFLLLSQVCVISRTHFKGSRHLRTRP